MAIANATGGPSASIGSGAQIGQSSGETVGGVDVAAAASDTVLATSYGVAAGYAGLTAVFADASSSPTVQSSVGSNAAITTTGAFGVTATDTPDVNAKSFGAAIAATVGVGAAISMANASGTTSSDLGAGDTIWASSIQVFAERSHDPSNDPTAQSSATAGAGGVLAAANATSSQATSDGTVEAYTGSSVVLIGDGVSIQATNQSLQSSSATGVAVGGLLAIGADVAQATSAVNTSAQLGTGSTVMVSGTLAVIATGTDENDASTTAGSGGLIAGDAAVGQTGDTSTVSPTIAGDIMAGTVDESAVNNSVFAPQVDSTNAALAGASGAVAKNTDNITADTTVGNNTEIMATSAVDITAQNTFTENLPTSGNTVSAGAGGFLNGTAALSTTTITGNADVTIGSSVTIDVENPPTGSTGTPGIFLTASSVLNTNDQVSLSCGGALEGAGTNSSLTATLNNNVTTESTAAAPDAFMTNQNIGIGTYSSVDAANTSEAHTWGVLGAVASSSAKTDVTSNQTVALGADTNLMAALNINLTAGDDPTPGALAAGPMFGNSNAQSYVRSLVAIPAASATTDLTSNPTLFVGAGDQIESGENTTLAADHGTPSATAKGIGHGYELGFIPVTDGSSKPSVSTSSSVTMNGSITAGYLHTLNITIPDNQSAQGGFYSNDVIVNGGTPTSVSTAPAATLVSPKDTAAFTASFDPSFNPYNTIVAAANDGELPGADATTDEGFVYDGSVGAMVLGTLFAAGGDVTVNAGIFQGSTGSITAYGGPTITVTNKSPDYLVLDSINIPDEPGGQVVYTGLATAAPPSIHVTPQSSADARPVVNIQELYANSVPSPTDSANGPSVFVTATMDSQGNVTLDPSGNVDNEAGQVEITVADGSLIQAGSLSATQVNFTTKKGVTAISNPTGLSANAGTPAADWDTAMYWPDFYDPYTDAVMPSDLASVYVAFVANTIFNSDGQYGSDPSDIGHGPSSIDDRGSGTGDDGFTEDLIGTVGQTPPLSFAYDPSQGLDNDEPETPDIVNGAPQAGTSVEFLGANTGDSTVITAQEAALDSPVGGAYQFGDITGRGEIPVVPVEPLPVTTAAYQPTFTGSLTSGSTSVTVPGGVTGMVTGEDITGTGIAPGTTIAVGSASFTGLLVPGSAVMELISNGPAPVIGSTVTGGFISIGTTVQAITSQNGNMYDVQISVPVASNAPAFTEETINLSKVTLSAPATVTGTESLTLSSGSAINAAAVFINALYVDVNEPINVGQPTNDSLSLPASLNSTIAQDQTKYNNGIYSTTQGDAQGYYTLPASTVSPGDSQIAAQYDAITGQIIVSNVSASSGGFISLDGAIMSTNTFGELNVNSDLGQATIDNLTNYPIVVNNVSASKSTTSTSLNGVDIIDTNQPAATGQTLFVYQPGSVIDEYQGTAGQTEQQLQQGSPVAVIQGNSTSYSPEAGLRWESQLQTDLTRTVTPNSGTGESPFSETPWAYTAVSGNPENDPWYYLTSQNGDISDASSQPAGWTVDDAGLPAFEETISGNVLNWVMADYIYHNHDYGFAPTDPAVPAPPGDPKAGQLEDPWAYYFATEVELTLTESVKADNPIGIDFSGPAQATISITSDTPVILAGNIANPLGDTTITAPSITQEPAATITTNNLTLNNLPLTATGSVGTATQPLDASLTANGVLNVSAGSQGAYLNLGSGALLGQVTAGKASTGYGNVVLSATGSLTVAPGLPGGTVNVTGNNIALTSTEGAVGTAIAPLLIQAQGVVNVAALQDIDLTQAGTGLQVGQIVSTTGDVTLNVPSGSIVNASGTTWTDEVDSPQSQQVWTTLGLTNPAANEQQAITGFENEVNADYVAYWQLLDNGSVLAGVFTLNAPAVALYSGLAALALDITNPTTAQVQGYANSQYQSYVTFFNQNLDSSWKSDPEFLAYDPTFSYLATSQQVSNLESNATWTTAELMNPVALVAVDPTDGTPVGIFTSNISGANVTLMTDGSIGQTSAVTDISLADLQSGNLTPAQESALANATAPGDVVVTSTGVEVSPNPQVFISATGVLTATSGGSVTIQATSPDLTLNTVTAGGAVNITAQESILGSGTGTQITTPGNTVLKVQTGTLGSSTTPLVMSIGGELHPYAPPGNIFITVDGLTAIPVTLTAVEGQPLSSTVSSHIVVASVDAPASITDPSDFTATIDWGDGTSVTPGVVAYDAAAQDFVVWASTDHVYTSAGIYTIAVTIDDASDGASLVADSTALIQAAALEPDPAAPGSTMLVIGGTTSPSDIILSAAPGLSGTVVTVNGNVLGTFQPTSRIVIFGQSGNDQFEVDAPLTVPVFVDGTPGTNSLTVVGDGANDAFTVTGNSVTVASPLSGNTPVPITLENIQSVTIDGGSGDDVFTIAGTAHGTTTTVNTGTGADTVDVEAIGARASINAGGGNDTINVSSTAPANTGTLAGIAAVLTVNGGSGTSTANVSDTGDGKSSTSTLNGTGLTSTAFGTGGGLSYSSLAALNVSLGSGGNTFTVANTAGGTNTVVNSGAGSDTVNVTETSSPLTVNTQTGTDKVNVQAIGAPASINAGGGNDTINVSSNAPTNTGELAGIAAVLTVSGGSGASTTNVSDTGDRTPSTSTLTGAALTSTAFGAGGSLSYSSLAKLNVLMGSGGNTFTVANTAAGTTTLVNSGTGADTVNVQATTGPVTVNTGGGANLNVVNVGSKEPITGGIVDYIQGALTVAGNGADTMNVDDTGSTTAKTATLTATTLTGMNMGPSGITYSGLATLDISLGSGGTTGNTLNIAVAAGTSLPANTIFNAGSGGHDMINTSWAGDYNGGLHLSGFATPTITVGGNFNGSLFLSNPGSIKSITIGGSVTASGVLDVFNAADPKVPPQPNGLLGDIGTMTVGGSIAGLVQVSGNINTLDVGPANTPTANGMNDLSGQVIVGGAITTVSVSGDVSGLIQSVFSGNSVYIGGSLTPSGVVAVSTPYKHEYPTLQNLNSLLIGQNLAGTVTVTGTLGTAAIGGSIAYTGTLTAGNLNSLSIGHDMAGQLDVAGMLQSMTVDGGTPGTIVANQIGTVGVYAGYGPVVGQIEESGVQRLIEAAVPSAPFPTPAATPQPPPSPSPAGVTFQYFYEGEISPLVEGIITTPPGLANAQLTIRVSNQTGSTAPDQFDLSLVTYSDTAKFNLVRLDATGNSGVSGIGNVAVEGDILSTITHAASTFFAADSSPTGVYLPHDNLASVSVRGYVPNGSIDAKSIQAVAFGSMSPFSGGPILSGAMATGSYASKLLSAGTAIIQAGSESGSTATFRVPFADTSQVGFFMDDTPGAGALDNRNVALTVQGVSTPNSTGTANIVTPSNVARGSVIALITAAETFAATGRLDDSIIQTVSLRGDGGSIQTQQTIGSSPDNSRTKVPLTPSISSTGPLGDVIIQGPLPDVTAPSIFGSLLPSGPIPATTIIRTTGLRTDPITGAVSEVPADLGRVYVTTSPSSRVPIETTTLIQANGSGLAGQIIVGGNLISQVVAGGGITGAITTLGSVNGNITINGPMSGRIVTIGNMNGSVTINGPVQNGLIATSGSINGALVIGGSLSNGQILSADNINGNVTINGGLESGRIAALGSINGSVSISGSIDSQSAIVAGGAIGNKTAGTGLSAAGTVSGILVSVGPMNVIKIGSTSKAVLYKQNDTTDAAVIDAIFSQGLLSSLSPTDLFDHATALDLENLSVLLANLNSLTVKSGKLQIG